MTLTRFVCRVLLWCAFALLVYWLSFGIVGDPVVGR
jgi:hypothetical protein